MSLRDTFPESPVPNKSKYLVLWNVYVTQEATGQKNSGLLSELSDDSSDDKPSNFVTLSTKITEKTFSSEWMILQKCT
jgi:hypothetical protein